MLAEIDQAAVDTTEIIVTVYDKFYNAIGECGDYSSLACSFPRNQVEAGKLEIPKSSPNAAVMLTVSDSNTVPITIEIGNLLWSGRVKIAHDNFNENDKADFIECELEGDYAWLMKILAWPDFLTPLAVQFPPRGVAIGPAISCLKFLAGTQAFRLQSGLWDIVNQISSLDLDWRTWFGTALMQDPAGPDGVFDLSDVMRMLRTPLYVVPTDPLTDTSEFISINWRMDKLGTLFEQTLKDNGLYAVVKLWRLGDPQPSDDPVLKAFPLTSATLVLDIYDRMGVIGPTGTFLDGILRTTVDLEGSVFGDVLSPFLNPDGQYAPEGWNIAPAIGVDFVAPWTIFNADNPQSGIKGRLSHHYPEAWRVIIGGHSPKWLDDLINATMSYLLDMVLIVVGLTGIPSNLFDGLFNDVALAFQLADNYDRRVAMGPYGYPEVFVATTTAPYNIDAIFALIREQWNTRGYIAGQVTFRQGEPYEVGRDIFPGALVSIIRDGKIYTDYVDNITITDTRTERAEVWVQVGDGTQQEAPIVKVQRKITSYEEAFNILTLATGSQ